MSAVDRTQDGRNWITDARSRLALRRAEKPTTKAAQIRALWPDIEAALEVGQSMKAICAWLAEDAGISLGVTSLTSYISRIRRRQEARIRSNPRIDGSVPAESKSSAGRSDSSTTSGSAQTNLLLDAAVSTASGSQPNATGRRDPLANVRASESKRPRFHYRPPTPEDEEKLI